MDNIVQRAISLGCSLEISGLPDEITVKIKYKEISGVEDDQFVLGE